MVGIVAVAVAATIGVASGSTTTKKFDASIAAPAAPTAASQTYTFTLRNDPASSQTFGSANVTVPAGYVLNAASFVQTVAGGSKQWLPPAYDAANRRIELRAPDAKNSVGASEAVVLTFDATASCGVARGPWVTDVRQSNKFLGTWNDFVGPSPTLAVTATAASAFAFDAIAPVQAVGSPFEVRVRTTDECGQLVPFDGTAFLSGLAGVAPKQIQFDDGVATTTLTPVQRQDDAVLSVGGASDPSNSFDVVTKLCTSEDPEEVCQASDADATTTVSTPRPPTGATMGLDFSAAENFVCEGNLVQARGALAIVTPAGYAEPIVLTSRWDKTVAPGTGVANFVFCMSKDGVAFAVVPACTKAGNLPGAASFCELKRSRNGVGDLVIDYKIAPNDPWGGLG